MTVATTITSFVNTDRSSSKFKVMASESLRLMRSNQMQFAFCLPSILSFITQTQAGEKRLSSVCLNFLEF